jgi:hypothetical protein
MHRLSKVNTANSGSAVEMAYRKFNCARTILTLIYRRIVRNDALRRILHPDVWHIYAEQRAGRTFQPYGGIPVEFSHGAFRFAHSMVRDAYRFNATQAQPNSDLDFRMLSCRRSSMKQQLNASWMVDWALFFDTRTSPDQAPPQYSQRIGPHYAEQMEASDAIQAKSASDIGGLAHRDFKSAIYAHQFSVRALIDKIRGLIRDNPADFAGFTLPDYRSGIGAQIRSWLAQPLMRQDLVNFKLGVDDVTRLASDPPWPFFVLCEAAFKPWPGEPVTTGMGQHLGPVGSIVVAETMFGALSANQLVPDEFGPGRTLQDAIAQVCRSFLGRADAIPELAGAAATPPEDMAAFLRFMRAFDAIRDDGAPTRRPPAPP